MISVHVILVFLILGFGLRMAVRLLYGPRGPQPDDAIYAFLTILGWVLLFFGIVPGVIMATGRFSALILAFGLGATIETLQATRTLARQANLQMLDLAVVRDLPVGPTLLKSTAGQFGRIGRAAASLAADLQRGVPLLTAFEQNRRAIPREAIAYAAIGEAVGEPLLALHASISTDGDSEQRTVWEMVVDRVIYLMLIVIVLLGVLTFLMIVLGPRFKGIFSEFGMELPAMTTTFFQMFDWLADNGQLLLAPLYLLLPVLVVIVIFYMFDIPVLQPLTDRQERRFTFRTFTLLQIGYPICIVLLAAAIGFVVISLFLPLVQLIHELA